MMFQIESQYRSSYLTNSGCFWRGVFVPTDGVVASNAHFARLTAVKRFLELLTAGRPVRSTSEKRRTQTAPSRGLPAVEGGRPARFGAREGELVVKSRHF